MAFGYIKRRLHRQIYATIVMSIILVVVVTGLAIYALDKDGPEREVLRASVRLVERALPPIDADPEVQKAALHDIAKGSKLSITLFDARGGVIAAYGKPLPPPRVHLGGENNFWHRHRNMKRFAPVWVTQLSDGRLIAIDPRDHRPGSKLGGIFFILVCIAAAIGLGSYPFVRKLTGRLGRLQQSVTAVGDGDMSNRAYIKGTDEVADLAHSFNEAADKIEGLINANRQLLAHASHELRTPLARIRLGVEMTKDKPDAKRQLALEQDIAELDELIDEILLMSRLDAGTNTIQREPVDLLALATEECARYENCSLDGVDAEVIGDPSLLRRVIRNLLDNAEKHGAPPIMVTIQAGAKITLAVSDQGKGIPEDQVETIFRPFQRAPGKQNVPGYGLGLALVKQISQTHGGAVEIIQSNNDGFRVVIEFPSTKRRDNLS